jgi:hypothetical protein
MSVGRIQGINERFPTDHTAYYFDFNSAKLFGNPTQTLASPAARLLQSNSTKQVTQNLRELNLQLEIVMLLGEAIS